MPLEKFFKPVYVTSDIKGATEFMQLLYIHNFRINKENNIDNNKNNQGHLGVRYLHGQHLIQVIPIYVNDELKYDLYITIKW